MGNMITGPGYSIYGGHPEQARDMDVAETFEGTACMCFGCCKLWEVRKLGFTGTSKYKNVGPDEKLSSWKLGRI